MIRLNDREWKCFNFTDVFDIQKGFYNKKPETSDSEHIPFLGATANNNGVTGWCSRKVIEDASRTGDDKNEPLSRKLFSGGCIAVTNNGSVGHAYYWPHEFTCSHDINPLFLRNRIITAPLAMFLIGAIEKQAVCFEYARKWRPARMIKSRIMLPVTDTGDPDYQFMEDYIRELMDRKYKQYQDYVQKQLAALAEMRYVDRGGVDLLKNCKWAAFPISDVFEIRPGKRLVAADATEGSRPFIGALDNNNGVARFVSDENSSLDKNVLGVNYNGNGMVIGFYHPYECIFSDDVKRFHLKHHEDNQFVLLFMKTCILMQKQKFGYLYKFNAERMAHTSIMLPTKEDGSPDYAFMELYGKLMFARKYGQYLSTVENRAS